MKACATTYRIGAEVCTLRFSGRDLRVLIDERSTFIAAIGIWENHTVSHGQNTNAWVRRSANEVKAAAELLQAESLGDTNWPDYGRRLRSFIEGKDRDIVMIRHFYAWWYPKWLDRWLT